MTEQDSPLDELKACYRSSPYPSYKVTSYFAVYAQLFAHLRGSDCTFIETGVLKGGSLFMWRRWLGDRARIIGIDLNPEAAKWRDHGFEIHIGDQGDRAFWRRTFEQIGPFDVLLDDGGHQSFQQIVTLTEAMRASQRPCIIAIEDTLTSFMRDFERHRQHAFLEFAKDATDTLTARHACIYPKDFPPIDNPDAIKRFAHVRSIEFFPSIVAFKLGASELPPAQLCWNHKPPAEEQLQDYRHEGVSEAQVEWPDPFVRKVVALRGGKV